MAKGLNKHTPDSEELLKRLNTNDSSGLDDFEKEALEGFESLDNIEEATRLTNSLNQKIDEVYSKKEGGNKKGAFYLSMAAGLVLVVGLSVFLVNYLGEKKELALSNTITTEENFNNLYQNIDGINPKTWLFNSGMGAFTTLLQSLPDFQNSCKLAGNNLYFEIISVLKYQELF